MMARGERDDGTCALWLGSVYYTRYHDIKIIFYTLSFAYAVIMLRARRSRAMIFIGG